jgi:4-carboxymuconolactone decarboxylase
MRPARQTTRRSEEDNKLPFHFVRARENGISKDELAELFTHLAFSAGWPNAMTAVRTAMEILAETE